MAHICECSPNSEGDPTAPHIFTCQGKVNAGKITMKDDADICKCKHTYVSIDGDEKTRLERVWKEKGLSFEWVWNEGDECYYPEFAE